MATVVVESKEGRLALARPRTKRGTHAGTLGVTAVELIEGTEKGPSPRQALGHEPVRRLAGQDCAPQRPEDAREPVARLGHEILEPVCRTPSEGQ
jgi:hypothetical protein